MNTTTEDLLRQGKQLRQEGKLEDMSNPVIIIAKQRSGTNLLRSLLTSSNLFRDFGEIFHPLGREKSHNNFWRFRENKLQEDFSLLLPSPGNLKKMFKLYIKHLQSNCNRPYFLIDIKYNSVNNFNPCWHSPASPPFLFELIRQNNIPVIHLVRSRVLENYCSELLARKTQVWKTKDISYESQEKIFVDIKDALKGINYRTQEISLFKSYLKDYKNSIFLEYSELKDNDNNLSEKAKKEIANLLNLNRQLETSPSKLRKVAPPLSELILNYNDLVSKLREANLDHYI